MSRNIPRKELKLLCMKSGGVCAFPGCGRMLIEKEKSTDEEVVLAEIAHIVAYEDGGPRGNQRISASDRNKHTNLILLCQDHHKIIDAYPNTYGVHVLEQMKSDHEVRIRRATLPIAAEPEVELKLETIYSSLLSVTHLPEAVFMAPCELSDDQESTVKQHHIRYPKDKWELVPFLIRENHLFTFHDLRDPNGPFASIIISHQQVSKLRATELWNQAEGKRRYQTLLNRALYKFTARLGIRYDPDHRRFYFLPTEEKGERTEQYRPLNVAKAERKVAWQPTRKSTGEKRNFWYHLAASLRFEQMATDQWCLSIRPERHLTSDGELPLPSKTIGPKVARLKAKMYNDLYLSEVNFWRDCLCQGKPQIILNFDSQAAIIDTQFLQFPINWLGIPDDDKPFRNQVYENDLFSLAELMQATEGEELEWGESEDDDTEDYDEEV